MGAGTPRSSYRFGPETLGQLTQIQEADKALTGIRPTATAVIEHAIRELHRRKLGRRASADARPIKRRGREPLT